MIENDILEALMKASGEAVAASVMPALPVKYIGRTFVIPDNGRWLELVQIPNNITNQYWGKEKTYRGLFRPMLHWGLDDAGALPPLRVIGSIAQYFEKGKTFQTGLASVKIYEQPDLTGVIEAPPETLYPVTIRYMSFRQ